MSELLEAVQSQREERARLEAELAPRHAIEAKTLAGLDARLTDLRGRVTGARDAIVLAREQRPGLETELASLTAGLGSARKAWVRLLEPVVASLALLVTLVAWGLLDFKSWSAQLGTAVGALVVQRLFARFSRG